MALHIAAGLDLPDDFTTQGVAIIGVRGSGKSNTEVRFAELLHGAGIPFVAVDPKGDWYGVRMEGTGPGLPIPVFGGLYGDFPLDEHNGARIADLLVDENLSAVLDVSRLSKTVALPRFLTEFCNRLMDRHQQEPHVRCVILEEAHRYIPQNVTSKTSALKEAAASLLLEGRAFGIGCWACTQRPARLHNDVLEEVDTAVIHRIGVTATADLKRVRDWVKHEDLGAEVSESLTKLRTGEAWVLSPIALGIVQRVQIDRRTTFDSGATPVTGAKRREMATMATIDAGAIKEALADAIEKADATDPKKLQARVRELEREIARVRAETPEPERIVETVEVERIVPVIPEEARALVGKFMEDVRLSLIDAAADLKTKFEAIASTEIPVPVPEAAHAPLPPALHPSTTAPARAPRAATPAPAAANAGGEPLGKGEHKVLGVLAQWPDGRTYNELAFLAGYSAKASTLGVILAKLRRLELVEPGNQPVMPTSAGLAAAGGAQALPAGPDLLHHWLRHPRMGEGERKVLLALIDQYPRDLTHDELCELTGYSPTASTMGVILSKLRKLGLVEKGARRVPAEFMEAIR